MTGSSCIYSRHFLKDREVDKGKWLMQPCWMVQTIRRGVGKGALGFKHFAAYSMSPCLAMERHSPSLNGRRVETFFRSDAWTWPSRTSGCNRDVFHGWHILTCEISARLAKMVIWLHRTLFFVLGPDWKNQVVMYFDCFFPSYNDFRHVQTS